MTILPLLVRQACVHALAFFSFRQESLYLGSTEKSIEQHVRLASNMQ